MVLEPETASHWDVNSQAVAQIYKSENVNRAQHFGIKHDVLGMRSSSISMTEYEHNCGFKAQNPYETP